MPPSIEALAVPQAGAGSLRPRLVAGPASRTVRSNPLNRGLALASSPSEDDERIQGIVMAQRKPKKNKPRKTVKAASKSRALKSTAPPDVRADPGWDRLENALASPAARGKSRTASQAELDRLFDETEQQHLQATRAAREAGSRASGTAGQCRVSAGHHRLEPRRHRRQAATRTTSGSICGASSAAACPSCSSRQAATPKPIRACACSLPASTRRFMRAR